VTRILVLVFVGAALVAGTADARPHDTRTPASVQVASVPSLVDDVLAAINNLRRTNGLRELRLNAALSLAALGHSRSMAGRGFFSHDGYDGAPFWARIKPRYRPQRGNFWGLGENMAWSSPDLSAGEVIQLWLDSPPHRKNLLAPSWRELGRRGARARRPRCVPGARRDHSDRRLRRQIAAPAGATLRLRACSSGDRAAAF
jgi:uncharacterized protein YkwD